MPGPPLSPLPRQEILEGLKRFPRWFYPFDLGQGVRVTPNASPVGTVDPERFRAGHAPMWEAVLGACGGSLEGLSVLDAGCFQGYWTLEAARAGAARAVGFDARPEPVEQARFCARAIGLPNASFETGDLLDIGRFGAFDVVFLFGVLYHVDRPVEFLDRVRRVTRRLVVVNTDVLPLDEPVIQLRYEDPAMELNAAGGALVTVPSVSAVVRMLRHVGFGGVEVLPPAPGGAEAYRRWRRAIFLARPTPDGKPEPPPPEVLAGMRRGHGERKLSWIPSALDRAPLGAILRRKLRRLLGRRRPPRSEA